MVLKEKWKLIVFNQHAYTFNDKSRTV